MLKYILKRKYLIPALIGFIAAQILALIHLILQLPNGSVIDIIGAYSFFLPFAIALFFWGREIYCKNKIIGVLMITVSIIIGIALLVDLFGLILP